MPLMARQVPKGARTSKKRQLRKSSCRSTGGGVRAQEGQGMVTGPALPPREGDTREHAPRLGGQPLAKWSLPHGGEQHKGIGRGGPTRNLARLRGPKPGLGMHVLKSRGGRGRDSGWCHLQEGDLLRAPRPLKDGDPGTGLGQLEGVKDPGALVGEDPRTGRHLRVQVGHKAHFSW
jgi:hypothetical protein